MLRCYRKEGGARRQVYLMSQSRPIVVDKKTNIPNQLSRGSIMVSCCRNLPYPRVILYVGLCLLQCSSMDAGGTPLPE